MKWKMVFLTGALVSAFAMGSIFGPSDSSANGTIEPQAPQYPYSQQGHYGQGMGHYFQGAMSTTVADLLGLSVEELQQLRLEGKSIQEIADEQGVKVEEIVSEMIAAKEEQVNELVEQGVITEEQKEYMLANMETRMEDNISRTDVGPSMGRGYRGNCSLGDGEFHPGHGMRGFGGQGRAF